MANPDRCESCGKRDQMYSRVDAVRCTGCCHDAWERVLVRAFGEAVLTHKAHQQAAALLLNTRWHLIRGWFTREQLPGQRMAEYVAMLAAQSTQPYLHPPDEHTPIELAGRFDYDAWRMTRQGKGRCVSCPRNARPGRVKCTTCAEKHANAKATKYAQRIAAGLCGKCGGKYGTPTQRCDGTLHATCPHCIERQRANRKARRTAA